MFFRRLAPQMGLYLRGCFSHIVEPACKISQVHELNALAGLSAKFCYLTGMLFQGLNIGSRSPRRMSMGEQLIQVFHLPIKNKILSKTSI